MRICFARRILAVVMVAALTLAVWQVPFTRTVSAASAPIAESFEDTFENYPLGHFTDYSKWPGTTEKVATGGNIEVVQDGTGQAIHLSLEYLSNSGSTNDAYLQTKSCNFNGKFNMSFKFKAGSNSGGNMEFRFRDTQSDMSKNTFSFVKISGNNVSYLPSLYSSGAPSETVDGGWHEITILADIPNGSMAVYRDGTLKNQVTDYRTYLSGRYQSFVFASSSIRTYLTVNKTVGDKSDIYLDDIRFSGDGALSDEFAIVPNGLYQKLNNTLYSVQSLKRGDMVCKFSIQNNTASDLTGVAVSSLYRDDVLVSQQTSPQLSYPAGVNANVEVPVTIPEVESNEVLKVTLYKLTSEGQTAISSPVSYYTSQLYRPVSVEILQDLAQKSPNNMHPRLMLTPDKVTQLQYACKNTEPYKTWYAKVKTSADSLLTASLCSYNDADAMRLSSAGTVLDRTFTLSMAYLIENNAAYKTRLYNELNNSANWPDWNTQHFLDTSAVIAAFGVAYDWLYSAWTPAEKTMIKNALVTMGLNKAKAAYDGTIGNGDDWWVTTDNNWSMVCNGGIAVGALALADESDTSALCGELLEKGLQKLEKCIVNFAPDGAWYEGPGYWNYTVQYMSMYFGSFETALGTDYGYLSLPGISKTGYFPIAMTGMQNTFNFNDASEGKINSPEQFFLAARFNNKQLATYRYRQIKPLEVVNGYSSSLKDLLWYDPALIDDFNTIQKDFYYSGTEVATFRNNYFSSDSMFVGIHGGLNGINHGNIDAGTFVYDAAGVRWAIDIGSDNYNLANYFNNTNVEKSRWAYYRNRGEGHNTIILNPGLLADQPLDKEIKITEHSSDDLSGHAVVDMGPLYPNALNSATRTMDFNKVTGETILTDNLNFKTTGNQLYWFMHTKAVINISDDGKNAILAQDGKFLKVSILDDVNTFKEMDAHQLPTSPDPDLWADNLDNAGDSTNPKTQNANVGIRKLAISKVNESIGDYQIKVSMKVIDGSFGDDFEGYSIGDFTDTSKWNINEKATASGGDIQIVQDGAKVLKTSITYNGTTSRDSYVESSAKDLNGKFVMSLKAKLTSNVGGSFQATLRDDNANAGIGTISLLSITDKKITYLPFCYDAASAVTEEKTAPSETISSNNTWCAVTLEGDMVAGWLRIYRDGVLKAEVTNLYTRLNGKFTNSSTKFNFEKSKVRLYTTVNGTTGSKIDSRVDYFNLTTVENTTAVVTPNYGDVNDDGAIDISDVVIAAEIAVGSAAYTPEQIIRANVDNKNDLTVDISDVVLIAERAVGGEDVFPILQ